MLQAHRTLVIIATTAAVTLVAGLLTLNLMGGETKPSARPAVLIGAQL